VYRCDRAHRVDLASFTSTAKVKTIDGVGAQHKAIFSRHFSRPFLDPNPRSFAKAGSGQMERKVDQQ
jgi:hypothetical protein